jgi:FdhE protein
LVTVDIYSRIIEKLDRQEREEGELPLLLKFYRELLRVQSRASRRLGTPKLSLSGEASLRRMRQGVPLINPDRLALDWALVQDTFAKVLAVFARYPELFGEASAGLKTGAARRPLTKKALGAWFKGKELPATTLSGVGEGLRQSIIQATLQPFLASHARALTGSINQEGWRRGYCPVCGGTPDLAFLDRETGARRLLCSRCDCQWLYQRLACPHCGNQEQATLSFFADEKELYRLYVCEKCRHYIKAIDLRKGDADVLLPLERLNTIDLDIQAQKQGYLPPGSPSSSPDPSGD